MPIYTTDPGRGINQPISNAPSGLGESLANSFEEGFREGPLVSAWRISQADSLADDPNSTVVGKAEADSKLKELGVKSVQIPDSGVTKAYLDHLTEERKDSLARQQIAASAPSGLINTPLNFMAGLAGAMADPANLAIGLIPFAGEAKAASLLGRAGERFLQGAGIGGLQTGITIPFTANAAAAEGDDYTMADAMGNIFLSAVGGGILHAGGGVIADAVRGRRATQSPDINTPETAVDSTAFREPDADMSPVQSSRFTSGDSGLADSRTAPLFGQAIADDLDNYAYSRAYDDVIPDYRDTLNAANSGQVGNVADLRAEISTNQRLSESLDASISDRTSSYQAQRMKFKDARARVQRDIDAEKAAITSRNDEIEGLLNRNREAERARKDIAALDRGDIPESAHAAISQRADEIKSGFNINPVSQGIKNAAQRINDAHWSVRESGFRSGISHMLQGRSPDLEPVFSLNDPSLRDDSFRQIQNGPRTDVEPSTIRASQDAESQISRANRDNSDLLSAREDLDAELELARNMVDDIDSPELRKALDDLSKEANDDSILKGLQAYATCMLRRI